MDMVQAAVLSWLLLTSSFFPKAAAFGPLANRADDASGAISTALSRNISLVIRLCFSAHDIVGNADSKQRNIYCSLFHSYTRFIDAYSFFGIKMATLAADHADRVEQQRLTSTVSSEVTGDGQDDFVACSNGMTLRFGESGVIARCTCSMKRSHHICV